MSPSDGPLPGLDPPRSPMHSLLQATRVHRLHVGVALVGVVGLEPKRVLDLRWSQVDLEGEWIQHGSKRVPLASTVVGLLRWHAARQRLDRIRSVRWFGIDEVLLDERGCRFSLQSADFVLEYYCEQAGLPAIPFSSLRHPCLR
mgnify:CR=1 FL=1